MSSKSTRGSAFSLAQVEAGADKQASWNLAFRAAIQIRRFFWTTDIVL